MSATMAFWLGKSARKKEIEAQEALKRVEAATKDVQNAASRLVKALEIVENERMELTLTKLVNDRRARPK
jgi:hypothetical protein